VGFSSLALPHNPNAIEVNTPQLLFKFRNLTAIVIRTLRPMGLDNTTVAEWQKLEVGAAVSWGEVCL